MSLAGRIDARVAAARARAVDRLATEAAKLLPAGDRVERHGASVRLAGPGLMRRWLDNGRLHGLVADATRGGR